MKSRLILVSFLLVLYIGPSLFAMSYASSATIPTEPNMSKDFAIASEWYDEGWLYRKSIDIDQEIGIGGTDYQVLVEVTFDSDMQNDFDDIVYTDNDGKTLLDHWRESYIASTSAIFWVKVDDYISENQPATIYMYYGNEEASTASNGVDTFEFYEDWTSESIGVNWTISNSGGSVSFDDTDAIHGNVIRIQGNAGDNAYGIHSDDSYTMAYATRFRSNVESTSASYQTVKQGFTNVTGSQQVMISSRYGNDNFLCRDDDGGADNQVIGSENYDDWFIYDITRDGTESELFVDGVEVAEGNNAPDAMGAYVFLYVKDSEYDLYNDWTLVRKFIADGPEVDSWGEEEDNLPPPEWVEVGEAELIFSVPVDETGLDLLLIFLGLCMIPASMLYMVKGGTSEMSTNKFFFGLIVFFLGWGLFLGGIFG